MHTLGKGGRRQRREDLIRLSDSCIISHMNKQYHPIRTWIGNVIRFELLYRLFVILIVYPLSNALINLYITTNTVHTSLSNFSMFFDFLSIPGILVMALILISAICIIVFEVMVLIMMTSCMIHRVPYTRTSLYSTAFSRLSCLRHPSTLLAFIYFMGLLPLTHIGYVSSYMPTLQIPNFILGEITLTLPGQLIAIAFYLIAFILFALLSFTPLYLFQDNCSFWQAGKKSIRTACALPMKKKLLLGGLTLGLFLLGWLITSRTTVPFLSGSDFNVYFFRYLYHSYFFRQQLLYTILWWIYLCAASLFFLWAVMRLCESESDIIKVEQIPERPFFAFRLTSWLGGKLRRYGQKTIVRLDMLPHKKLLSLLLCPLVALVMMLYLQQAPLLHRPLVIGHRGDIYAPENSLAGIESAALHGADYAEIDIQLTADGELAVFHDSSTSRLCDQDLSVTGSTLAQLKQLDLVSRNQHFTIPSLDEAIQKAKEEQVGLLIEFKPREGQEEEMAEKTIQLIEENDFEDEAIFMSMNETIVRIMEEKRESWWNGYCIFGALGKVDTSMNVDFLAIEENQANTRFLEQARKNGIPVYIWTVDEYYSVLGYLRMGVSGIIGNSVEDVRLAIDDYLANDHEEYLVDDPHEAAE